MRATSVLAATLLAVPILYSQTPAAAAPAPPSPWTKYGTDFSIWLDGYTEGNFNHPDSGWNDLRSFDFRSGTAHLNLAKISIDHAPAPLGFHFDFGGGQSLYAIHAADPGPDAMKYVEQAYVSAKPREWKGLEVDFGKFVTSAGAEGVEAYSNWNYSRSLLYTFATPVYHMGLRTSFPIGAHFTGGVQVVNGWNNDRDNNSGKTVGVTGAYTFNKKVTWTNTVYSGPEKNHTNQGVRTLYDSIVQYNHDDATSYSFNFDYGHENNPGLAAGSTWSGGSFMARRAIGSRFAIAPRVEIFNDADGFTTGVKQVVKEVTLTGEYRASNWLIARLEFRNDWSDKPAFNNQSSAGGLVPVLGRTQPTIALALLAYFGPKK